MSYATLGTNCLPKTCALTSNKKFLLPNNPVYFKPYTKMFEYPGHDHHIDNRCHSKNTSPHNLPIRDIVSNQCKKCN